MTRKKLADLLREEQGKNTEPSTIPEEEITETSDTLEVETLQQEVAQLRTQLAKIEKEKEAALEAATQASKELEKVRKEALELAKANTKLLAENGALTEKNLASQNLSPVESPPHWEQRPSRVVTKSLPPLVNQTKDDLPTWML